MSNEDIIEIKLKSLELYFKKLPNQNLVKYILNNYKKFILDKYYNSETNNILNDSQNYINNLKENYNKILNNNQNSETAYTDAINVFFITSKLEELTLELFSQRSK